MLFQAGSRLGPYEVLAPLGAGGMGEVYRARDPRLGREVALKLLPEAFARDPERIARFEREARSLAALNHPGIGAIYGLEDSGGTRFLVLELVPGQTLSERLRRGPLPVREALGIGAQIAEALGAAHRSGILHRDLKPSNVQVTPDGKVKLLDFGLAKALEQEAAGPVVSEAPTLAAPESAAGVVVGTAAYMSPEQARGRPVDQRTDIWSFGCVLYEALSGVRAFRGESVPDTLAAVLEREPDWQALPEATPEPVRSLLTRCLRKDPARRVHDIADARIELEETAAQHAAATGREPSRRWGQRSARRVLPVAGALAAVVLSIVGYRRLRPLSVPTIHSIAVLPLENLSGDPGQEYLADGMTEALISTLGSVGQLRVISRTSVMPYKGAHKTVPKIAAELGVDAVVEGSIQRSGDRVQVSARLIDASAERRLWTHTYQRDLGDVLALENDVASAVAREIRVELTAGERERLSVAQKADPRAYDAYLVGLYQLRQADPQSVPKAIESFSAAIKIDPSFALAHAGLANAYLDLGTYFMRPPREAFALAEKAALEAVQLDPTLAEAHASLAFTKADGDWDWAGAEASFRRAIELNENYAYAHEQYGLFLVLMGRSEQGLREIRKAVELDPLGLQAKLSLGAGLYHARRFEDSIRVLNEALEMDPDIPPARSLLAINYIAKGMYEESITESQRAVELSRRLPLYLCFLGYGDALAGKHSQAREILHELKARREHEYVDASAIGLVYAGLGEWDEAMAWVERGYEGHSDGLVYAKVAPFLDPMRGWPRFDAVVRRMNFPD
jgi:TolB-like protein/Tfp pilus assembly protein PilF